MIRSVLWLIGLGLLSAFPLHAAAPAEPIVHMLDYMAVDYAGAVAQAKVIDEGEYKEMRDFAAQILVQLQALPATPEQSDLVKRAKTLVDAVEVKATPAEVAQQATALRRALIEAYAVIVAPKRAPDIQAASSTYASLCAGCHGVDGKGDGAAAAGMDPPPANFRDTERMRQRSVYGLYNTITLGVDGTSMASYAAMTEAQRWALAFYVANIGRNDAEIALGLEKWKQGAGRNVFGSLREITTATYNDSAARGGVETAAIYSYLIAHPEAVQSEMGSPLQTSKKLLAESVDAYAQGNRELAQRLAVSSYLEGFELAEAAIDAADADLRIEVEEAMVRLRSSMRNDAGVNDIREQARAIEALLDRADALLGDAGLSPSAAALSSFVILLREGLEAILVLAAVIAFLIKAERRDALRYVHAGWIGALILGIGTWFAATYVVSISGAGRELTEGITALIAAAVLLYVGFWMHSKAYAQAWQRYVREKLQGALSRGTVWALAMLSFLAVYREIFEVVLFYQALWTQAGNGGGGAVIGGFVAAAVALFLISWAIFRYGVRLPLGVFFGVSSVLMAVLAVVFVGKGIAALQEAGRIAIDVVDFPRIGALGVYPTIQSLAAQAALVLVIALGFTWTYCKTGKAAQRS
ncbi:MAG TPA: cytochrome c/FTR1 family iron permease [Burkholderiales bacterium]|nr:cytochrome c/FTR1 family iron permease [Burkholderiales bacterium]